MQAVNGWLRRYDSDIEADEAISVVETGTPVKFLFQRRHVDMVPNRTPSLGSGRAAKA